MDCDGVFSGAIFYATKKNKRFSVVFGATAGTPRVPGRQTRVRRNLRPSQYRSDIRTRSTRYWPVGRRYIYFDYKPCMRLYVASYTRTVDIGLDNECLCIDFDLRIRRDRSGFEYGNRFKRMKKIAHYEKVYAGQSPK